MLLLSLVLISSFKLLLGLPRIATLLLLVLGLPMWLLMAMRLWMMFFVGTRMEVCRHLRDTALQVDIDAARVMLSGVLQAKFPTYLFNAWLKLLDVSRRMVSFPDDARCLWSS